MSNIAQSVEQARELESLFGRRAAILESLSVLDNEIETAQKTHAAAPKPKRGRPKATNGAAKKTTPTTAGKRGRGRPKGSKNKPKDGNGKETTATKRHRNKTSLGALILKILGRSTKGLELQAIVEKCHAAGYQSTSDEKGYVQNIRTNLNTLTKKGVITRGDDKKYHVAEAAKEEAAA